MQTIAARLKLVIEAEVASRGRYSFLGGRTAVSAGTWRTWWTRGGVPNGALVEAAASLWPQYAYWLATGCTDARCGHIRPLPAGEVGGAVRTEYSQAYLNGLQSAPRSAADSDNAQGAAALGALREIAARRIDEIAKNFERAQGA